jgi:hypothetical protein
MFAEAYANLCSIRTGIGGDVNRDAINEMHRFQNANPEYFVGSTPFAPIAVLVSLNQAMANRKDAVLPFMRFMEDLGLEFQVILDDQVTEENLKKFDCVVLAATDLLSEPQMAALEAYKNVGKLVVFGPSGTRDEWDRNRPDGLKRLVGDLAAGENGKQTMLSPDGRVAFVPLGICENFPANMWYRRGRDCNMDELRKAFEGTIGKAWPYLVTPSQTREIHLAKIDRPNGVRLTIHVVNYDITKAADPSELAVRLPQGATARVASIIRPEDPTRREPVKVEQVTREGKAYAQLTVPSVQSYGVVAVDCDVAAAK